MVGVGYPVGFRLRWSGWCLRDGRAGRALGVAVCCVSAYIGLAVKDEESVQAFGLIWVFP